MTSFDPNTAESQNSLGSASQSNDKNQEQLTRNPLASPSDQFSTSPTEIVSISPPDPYSEAILRRSDFYEVNSLDELRERYLNKGLNLETTDALVEQVKKDWKIERLIQFTNAIDSDLPDEFPITEIEVEGEKYQVCGIVHTFAAGFEYLKKLISKIESQPWWTFEHNLKSEFLPLSRAIEIPDHFYRGELHRVAFQYSTWLKRGFTTVSSCLTRLKTSISNSRQMVASEKRLLESTANLPDDIFQELPDNIDLLRRDALGIPYNSVQERSAYQATFIKHWEPSNLINPDIDKSKLPFGEEAWKTKGILVGKAHAQQVIFFLKHGAQQCPEVEQRAIRDVTLLNQDYQAWANKSSRRELVHIALNTLLSAGIGIAIGKGLVWSIIGLNHLFGSLL